MKKAEAIGNGQKAQIIIPDIIHTKRKQKTDGNWRKHEQIKIFCRKKQMQTRFIVKKSKT